MTFFLSSIAPNFDPSSSDAPRTFAGVAYSGGIIPHHGWKNLVIDLTTVRFAASETVPVLLEHNRECRVGVCTLHVEDGSLKAKGKLLSNEGATQLAADADAGFPWQMSVHAEPDSVDIISAGAIANVNGMEITGPATVFRNTTIREVSFCVTGQDKDTSANVFNSLGSDTMTEDMIQQLSAKLEAAEAALKLRVEKEPADSVRAILGADIPQDKLQVYLSITNDQWEQIKQDVQALKASIPSQLFSDTATRSEDIAPSLKLNITDIYNQRK
jgi:hypothetical protein